MTVQLTGFLAQGFGSPTAERCHTEGDRGGGFSPQGHGGAWPSVGPWPERQSSHYLQDGRPLALQESACGNKSWPVVGRVGCCRPDRKVSSQETHRPGFHTSPWLLVEMRGNPVGVESNITKVTSTASVLWRRKEAGQFLIDYASKGMKDNARTCTCLSEFGYSKMS